MCGICGCGQPPSEQTHAHPHSHHDTERLIKVEQDLLSKNNHYAALNRQYFQQQKILALNFVSSPGAGKTSLLVETIKQLDNQFPIYVIEGDQQTEHDAERIRATGTPALQINTGRACHLDAHEIGHALSELKVSADSLLAIENVGNLVCPSGFDLGEAHKVVILSVTEGDDKPLKYSDMFHAADLMIINKIDLLPYVDFNIDRCIEFARRVNPDIEILQLSSTKGLQFNHWVDWLTAHMRALDNNRSI